MECAHPLVLCPRVYGSRGVCVAAEALLFIGEDAGAIKRALPVLELLVRLGGEIELLEVLVNIPAREEHCCIFEPGD